MNLSRISLRWSVIDLFDSDLSLHFCSIAMNLVNKKEERKLKKKHSWERSLKINTCKAIKVSETMDQRKKSNSNRKGFTFNLLPRLNFTCHIILLPDILNIKYYFHQNPYWHNIIFGILLLFFSRLFLFAIFCLLFATVIKILCSSCFFGFRQWSCSRSNFRIFYIAGYVL